MRRIMRFEGFVGRAAEERLEAFFLALDVRDDTPMGVILAFLTRDTNFVLLSMSRMMPPCACSTVSLGRRRGYTCLS